MIEGTDAICLISSIREIPTCATTPVFVLSGLLHSELIHKVFALGRTDFISLPIQWLVLIHRIQQAISLRRLLERLEASTISLEEARQMAADASEEAMLLRHYDRLTGLPNRSMFLDSVGLAMNQNERAGQILGILLLDIDNFKTINESIGRAGGDQLLLAIARRLQRSIRPSDFVSRQEEDHSRVSLARMGGNEFAIFIGQLKGPDDARAVAKRLLKAFQQPYRWEGREHFLSASIGIALEDDTTSSEETLFQRAEHATRDAKGRTGPSYSIWEASMRGHAAEKLEVKNDFMRAIDRGQLFLRYQPIIDSRTGVLIGAEGLLRWRHPERGLVSPSEFIPIAEDNGLATQIGEWVLREGCRQAKKWSDEGIPLKTSLNVSTEQLVQGTVVQSVHDALEETGLNPELLQLELSERGALRDDPEILQQLNELNDMGITLAIDDFGIGQTALSYLATLPVQVIKIDRFFVESILKDEASASITGAIIAISRQLGLTVVAEGVEEEEQAAFLRESGCEAIQGFLYYRPLPARELQLLLQSQREFPSQEIVARQGAQPIDVTPTGGESEPRSDFATSPVTVPVAEPTLKRAERDKQMLRLAHRDFLTDLLNRYAFDERLELALAQGARFEQNVAVFLIDLDLFKQVNDTHGHHIGDQLLVQIADRLKNCLREVDALARLGGDEFAIVHSGFQDLESVSRLADRLIQEVTAPFDVDGRRLMVSASVGIAIDTGGMVSAAEIVKQADRALYKAKADGKDCFRYHAAEMDHRMLRTAAIGDEIRGAQHRGELFLEYQPQFDLRTGALHGVEALLRWESPLRGLVDPAEFVPIVEANGEILPIGEWVIRTACEDARRLKAQVGRDLTTAINLSAVQFSTPDFFAKLQQVLTDTQIDPRRVELEISEDLLERSTPLTIEALRALHGHGVRLTLDNFGRGSGSLEHFARLPFDKVKIDGRWLAGSETEETRKMIGAVIRLAKRLGLIVVACGVERGEQAEFLINEGCDLGQGYHFGRPATVEELEQEHPGWEDGRQAIGAVDTDGFSNVN